MNLANLTALFADAGCTKLYAKLLAENDNSKNQIYLAGAVETLNIFPSQTISAGDTAQAPSFKASLNFGWLLETGKVAPAPKAQFILYPQYPEVRFSGFLAGCKAGPNELMIDRQRAKVASSSLARKLVGRILLLGITRDRTVLGYVAAGNSVVAAEFKSKSFPPAFVVFREVPLPNVPGVAESRRRLLTELCRINRLGWINSKQLNSHNIVKPCLAPQCGGFTLEAELGIPKNSDSEPDFLGWEVKQHSVKKFTSQDSSAAITLMTPEPTGGLYKECGVEAFIRKFGYPDKNKIPDRLNVGGIHRVGERQASTGLTMRLMGYDSAKGKLIDANGGIALVSDKDEVAAMWAFDKLLDHWSRKHMRAVYVPSMHRTEPCSQYAYGGRVRLAQQTDSLRLLAALASGTVYYDPGIKLENASGAAVSKRRSQFRVASKSIGALYETIDVVEL